MNNAEVIQTEEYPLFQEEYGGAVPTSPLQMKIEECNFNNIRNVFKRFHYKKDHMGGGISFCLKATYEGNTMGGMVIGKLRHENKYTDKGKKTIEIRRMALLDDCPKNSESWFLGKALWYMRKFTDINKVISYSDLSVGHIGTIYKASNFKLIGKTAPSKHIFWKGRRYHPRSLTINRPYSYELRKAIEKGDAIIQTGKPKLIYEYILNV